MSKIVIYYDSRTGNVQRFVKKLSKYGDFEIIKIAKDLKIDEFGHLITFTTGIGEISEITKKFLLNNENYKKILSVSSSGNMNWGKYYALAADKISNKLKIPVLMKFELSGNHLEVEKFAEKLNSWRNEK